MITKSRIALGLAGVVAASFSTPLNTALNFGEQEKISRPYAIKDEETETERLNRIIREGAYKFRHEGNQPPRTYQSNHNASPQVTRRQMPAHQDYREQRATNK